MEASDTALGQIIGSRNDFVSNSNIGLSKGHGFESCYIQNFIYNITDYNLTNTWN